MMVSHKRRTASVTQGPVHIRFRESSGVTIKCETCSSSILRRSDTNVHSHGFVRKSSGSSDTIIITAPPVVRLPSASSLANNRFKVNVQSNVINRNATIIISPTSVHATITLAHLPNHQSKIGELLIPNRINWKHREPAPPADRGVRKTDALQ